MAYGEQLFHLRYSENARKQKHRSSLEIKIRRSRKMSYSFKSTLNLKILGDADFEVFPMSIGRWQKGRGTTPLTSREALLTYITKLAPSGELTFVILDLSENSSLRSNLASRAKDSQSLGNASLRIEEWSDTSYIGAVTFYFTDIRVNQFNRDASLPLRNMGIDETGFPIISTIYSGTEVIRNMSDAL
jgi:hypothetical protein